MQNSTGGYAGCGSCSSATANGCQVCGSSGCNNLVPSQIACFSYSTKHSSSSSNDNFHRSYGFMRCNSGLTTCYSVNSGMHTAGGCGGCTDEDSALGCKTCSTNFCDPIGAASSADGLGNPGWVAPAAAAAVLMLMLRDSYE